MRIIDDKNGISKNELYSSRDRFRLGDEVGIPAKLFDDLYLKDIEYVEAIVQQICKNHIVFKLKKSGFVRSFLLVDCQNIFIIKKSTLEAVETDISLTDILTEMSKKERH